MRLLIDGTDMTQPGKPHIFFVDDEPKVCKAVATTLLRADYYVTSFTSPIGCLQAIHDRLCDLLICDVKMPEMNGLSLLGKAKGVRPTLPVIMVTGFGDIPLAVKAMKAGAVDFVEKPLDRYTLLPVIESVLEKHNSVLPATTTPLTNTETRIMKFIIEGKSNKEIAFILHRSVRTIEDHRNHLMQKFGVKNVVDLVRLSVKINLDLRD